MVAFMSKTSVEPINGKNLGDAAEAVSQQLKYVSDEVDALRKEEGEPITPEKSKHLKAFLDNLNQIEDNARQLLTTSSARLNTVKADVRLRLMAVGFPSSF